MAYFATHPAALQRLRLEPKIVHKATEELIRYFSPLTHMGRVVTEDTQVCNHAVKADSRISLCWASANRDATVFERPNEVVLDVIEKVGSGITEFSKGDKVILNWATPCMSCFQCQEGNQHICENNSPVVAGGNGHTPGHAHLEGTKWNSKNIERSFNLGTLSEYVLVKESALVKVEASKLNFSAAAIISCGVMMTGYGSVVSCCFWLNTTRGYSKKHLW